LISRNFYTLSVNMMMLYFYLCLLLLLYIRGECQCYPSFFVLAPVYQCSQFSCCTVIYTVLWLWVEINKCSVWSFFLDAWQVDYHCICYGKMQSYKPSLHLPVTPFHGIFRCYATVKHYFSLYLHFAIFICRKFAPF